MNSTSNAFSVLWQTTGWTMLHFLWIGGLSALAASLMTRAVRRRSPEMRYAVAVAQFALLALIPCCLFAWKLNQPAIAANDATDTSHVTVDDVPVPAAGAVPADVETGRVEPNAAEEHPQLSATDAGHGPARDEPFGPARDATAPPSHHSTPLPVAKPAPALLRGVTTYASAGAVWISNWLPWVWVVGFPLTCLGLLTGIAGAERFRRQCRILDEDRVVGICRRLQALLQLARNVALGVSDSISTPILVGIVRPLILLPASTLAGLSTSQLEMILLHELAHVQRWDNFVNLLQRIVEAVLFFHPAIWWLSNRVRLEREHCCDAVVVAHLSGPEKYAEMLVQMALSSRRPEWALSTSISQQLIPRIRHILNQDDQRMQVSRSLVAVALSLLVSAAAVTVAWAQREPARTIAAPPADASRAAPKAEKSEPQKAQTPPTAADGTQSISIQGTVLRDDGEPARFSKVWLLGMTNLPGGYYGAAQIEVKRTDENGKFEFRHSRWREHNPGPDDYWALWVLARTRNGTFTSNARLNLTGEFRGKSEIHGLELKALPRADYSGRIVDQNGKPIPNSKVVPEFLVLPRPKGAQISTMAWPPELAAEYTAVTDAEGKFTLTGLPKTEKILALISAPSLGTRGISWSTDTAPELRLVPGGTIRGTISNAPDDEFCSQIELALIMHTGDLNGREPVVRFLGRCRVQADGTFEMENVPPGPYNVQIVRDRVGLSMPREFFAPASCDVKSGQVTEGVELRLPKVIVARGRVVDRENGEGIAGAGVTFYEEHARHRDAAGMATTDAGGEYRAYLTPGKIAVDYGRAPDDYLTPIDDEQSVAVMRKEDFEGPTLRLQRAIKLRGTIVDEEGRPVARADVRWIQPLRTGRGSLPDIVSDESGNFLIPQLDAQEALPLRVRSTAAGSTAKLLLEPADLGQPQRIVVSPQNAFRLKGRLTDESGQPVADAEVVVHWHRTYVSKQTRMSGSHGELEKLNTDEQGRFEFGALWPDDGYHVVIEAKGFSKTDLRMVKGRSGEVHDFGAVRLNNASHAISGRVVDSDGKPVTSATVFNSGDAPGIVRTSTDKDGRFRLQGLLAGPVHIFAEHDKCRFTGTYAKGGPDEVLLTLTPRAAPPPPRRAVDFDAFEAVRRQQAEQFQEWLKTTNFALRPNLRDSRFAAMVKTDPQETLNQIGKQSPAMDYRSAVMLARNLTPKQPRKGDLNADDKTAVEVALKFVERAVSRIDDLDASRRMFARADAGLMFLRLGDSERGQPLVEAAAKEWSQNSQPVDSSNSYAVVTIAQGLAWTDVPRALAYLETGSDESLKAQIRSRVILEVSRFDVPRALALLNDPKYAPARDIYNDSLKYDLAYRIGPVNPQKSADLVDSIGNPRTKAEACGWTAVAISAADPKLARSLIDQGLNQLRNERAPASGSFYYEYVPGVAAHLAQQASQINHPEIESIVQQALALRIPVDPQTSTVSRLQSTVNAALFLAFVDPIAARRLLADLEPAVKGHLLGDGGYASVGRREWYYAWVLADPEHAVELLRVELENVKDPKDKTQTPWQVQEAFTFMSLPASERLDYILEFAVANLSKPYQE